MSKNWRSPKIIIGNVAIGGNFFNRNDLVKQIWNELKKGNSVLLAAPRRVGKTSVMQYMEKKPIKNYKLIFQNIQGINSANEFFERIYTLLLNCLNKTDKAKKWLEKFLKSKSITEISLNGIKFEKNPTDFLAEINTLLREINNNPEIETIVLLLDELPEVLFRINQKSKEDAVSILKNLRHWRQQPDMNKKIKFILAGSGGIHYVVDKIEKRNTDLNDLKAVDFYPLSDSEAHKYIDWATKGATVTYDTELKQHLLNKIQYFVPYFINLLLEKIDEQAYKISNSKITKQSIDNAFDMVVKHSDYFEDWKKRLQNYMPVKDFKFVNDILTHTAHKGHISLQEIYDKAVEHNKTTDYMEFIKELEKDGYIIEVENKYQFVSSFLSSFWKRNSPTFNA